MKEIIRRCDRCKQTTEALIDIQMVNTTATVEKSEEFKEKEQPSPILMFSMTQAPKHPTIEWEICEDCAKELIRWSGHVENQLINT